MNYQDLTTNWQQDVFLKYYSNFIAFVNTKNHITNSLFVDTYLLTK